MLLAVCYLSLVDIEAFPTSHFLSEPLTQIVGGVGLLLAGVLNLLGKLVGNIYQNNLLLF